MLALFSGLQFQLAALACATCGCNELCPVVMMDESTSRESPDRKSVLSNSIWGNLILKMAYERDPALQKLRGKSRGVYAGSTSTLAAAAAGTLGQGVVAMATLNPPDGMPDSYVPGIAGVALEGVTGVALLARFGMNAGLRKKIRARQKQIRAQIEVLLQHLEFSQTSCPEAKKELTQYIGEKAAGECVDLWFSSHTVASLPQAGG